MMRLSCLALLLALSGIVHAGPKDAHQFGVIGHVVGKDGEAKLKEALETTGDKDLSFVVVNGIKGKTEPCSDSLYAERRDLLEQANGALIPVPAASDWSDCRNSAGRPAGIERLNRLREVLYQDQSTLGARHLPLVRLSGSGKFRSYAENAHWMVGSVLYATLNIPANNNNFRPEAGRNSEYEDRLVANRFWLKRLFAHAERKNAQAIVLFSEGDIKAMEQETGLRALLTRANPQDGYAEARKLVAGLAGKFEGKVLLVDTGTLAKGIEPAIAWKGNLGHLSVGTKVVEVKVVAGSDISFALRNAGN